METINGILVNDRDLKKVICQVIFLDNIFLLGEFSERIWIFFLPALLLWFIQLFLWFSFIFPSLFLRFSFNLNLIFQFASSFRIKFLLFKGFKFYHLLFLFNFLDYVDFLKALFLLFFSLLFSWIMNKWHIFSLFSLFFLSPLDMLKHLEILSH